MTGMTANWLPAGLKRRPDSTARGLSDTAIDERDGDQQVVWRPESMPRRIGRHAAARYSQLPVSLFALSAALGFLLVAAAYAAGRHGQASSALAVRVYWLGQALIVVPTAIRLLGRQVIASAEILVLITSLTVAEYLVTICYNPTAFSFADELEHWRSTVNVLQAGKLFTANYMLPISPQYPGLEELTSALVTLTGLPIYTAGLIVAGTAHLLFVYVLYVIFREISHSDRIGGVAVLCYASNPHFVSFDSMFIYQTLALPFLGLTLLAAWRLSYRPPTGARAGWLGLALIMLFATVVTHHVTSYALTITLAAISLTGLATRNLAAAAWAGSLALLSAVAAIGWMRFAAPDTWGYLKPFADETLQGIRALVAGGKTRAPPTSVVPTGNQELAAASVLAISALVPVGWWRVWRDYRRQVWPVTLAVTAAGWYVIVAVRLTVIDGSELAGRAATFIYVSVAYVVALAVSHLARATWQWQKRILAAAALTVVPMLIFDGLANGWPPYWERLPGPHQVAGSERSVGPEEIAAARWTLAALGPGNRFATDYGNSPILGSYGDQNPVLNVGYLFTSPVYTLSVASQAQALEVRYLLIDQRLSQSLPASGQYFPVDANAGRYTHPLPLADLTKFNHAPGVARIFDDGTFVIYDLDGAGNAP